MKKLVMIALMLGGCVADIPVEQPEGSGDTTRRLPVEGTIILAATDVQFDPQHRGEATVEISTTATLGRDLRTLCREAQLFPSSDACSLMCDPDRVVARSVSDGLELGTCVDYQCAVSGQNVNVNVCLSFP